MSRNMHEEPAVPGKIPTDFTHVRLYLELRNRKRNPIPRRVDKICWMLPDSAGETSTSRSTLHEAMRDAGVIDAQITRNGKGALTATYDEIYAVKTAKRNIARVAPKVPLLDAVGDWVRAHEMVGDEIIDAARHWARIKPTLTHKKLSEAIALFIAQKVKDGYSAETYRYKLDHKLVARLGDPAVHLLDRTTLSAFLIKYYPDLCSREDMKKRLKSFFVFCRQEGFLPDSKLEIDSTSNPKVVKKTPGVMSAATMKQSLQALVDQPELIMAFVFSGLLGIRSCELGRQGRTGGVGQLFEDIHLDESRLNISAAKTGTIQNREVRFNEAAKAWMAKFTSLGFLKPTGRIFGSRAISRARDLLTGTVRKGVTTTSIWVPAALIPENALRHSFISYAKCAKEASGLASVALIAEHCGTSPKVITKNYTKIMRKEDGEAWFALRPEDLTWPAAQPPAEGGEPRGDTLDLGDK